MAGLLDPDFVIGRDGISRRIEPPTDGLLAITTPTWADAWQFNTQAAGDWIDKQRAISAERGLWDDATGLPTAAGVVDAAGQTAQGIMMGSTAPKGIRAYHGSLADFSRFSDEFIGTGEGAQAYSRGHYFADDEELGQFYRKKLAGPSPSFTGEISPELSAALQAEDWLGFETPGQALQAMRNHPDWQQRWDVENPGPLRAAFNAHEAAKYGGQGRMYEVNIKADPEHFLDWDRPLSEQHPVVQQGLGKLGIKPPDYSVRQTDAGYVVDYDGKVSRAFQTREAAQRAANETAKMQGKDPTGQEIYRDLQQMVRYSHPNYDKGLLPPPDWQPPAGGAEGALREAGIPGVRYLDARSRAAGEGTRNTVVYDPSQIEILRKYLALLTAGGAGGMAAIGGRSD